MGGAVLGWMSGRPAPDVDAVTTLDGAALASLGGTPIGGRFDTHAWRREEALLEVSPLRECSLAEDLAARDFTIHAVAARWPDGRVCDPCGGRRDRDAGQLRSPNGIATFRADAVRILRGWRRIAHGWRWHAGTLAAARGAVDGLLNVPPARQGPEWLKLLVGAQAGSTLRAMGREPGLLAALHPVFAAMAWPPPPPRHAFTPWIHTSHVVAALPPDPALRLAALFHDSGKALPRLTTPGPWPVVAADAAPWHSAGHAGASRAVLARTAALWALPGRIAERALRLVAAHTFDPAHLCADAGARRAWLAEVAPEVDDLLALLAADRRATGRAAGAPALAELGACVAADQASDWPRRPADLPVDAAALFTRYAVEGAARSRLLRELWLWVLQAPSERANPAICAARAAALCADAATRPPDRS